MSGGGWSDWWERIRGGAGGEKPDTAAPAGGGTSDPVLDIAEDHDRCLNCNTPLKGEYCYNCGQRDDDFRRPFVMLSNEFLSDQFQWDSRIVRSFMPFLLMPGKMTRAFMSGERGQYVSPLRLYLVISLLFFIVLTVANVAILKFEVHGLAKAIEQAMLDTDGRAPPAPPAAPGVVAIEQWQTRDLELPDRVTLRDGYRVLELEETAKVRDAEPDEDGDADETGPSGETEEAGETKDTQGTDPGEENAVGGDGDTDEDKDKDKEEEKQKKPEGDYDSKGRVLTYEEIGELPPEKIAEEVRRRVAFDLRVEARKDARIETERELKRLREKKKGILAEIETLRQKRDRLDLLIDEATNDKSERSLEREQKRLDRRLDTFEDRLEDLEREERALEERLDWTRQKAVAAMDGGDQVSEDADQGSMPDFSFDTDGLSFRVRMFTVIDENEAPNEQIPEAMINSIMSQTDGDEESIEWGYRAFKAINLALADPRIFNDILNVWLPRVMVFLVPLVALFLSILYGRKRGLKRRVYFIDHLVFSLYFHAFIFTLMLALVLKARLIGDVIDGSTTMIFFVVAISLYLFAGMKQIYGQGYIKTTLKFVFMAWLLFFTYSTVLFSITIGGLLDRAGAS